MSRINKRNGAYQVIIELGRDERTGRRLRYTKDGFKTKKEANAFAVTKENELLNNIIPNNSKILLKDFITDWYENHISKTNLALNTIVNYKARIDTHIIPYLGNMKLSMIQVVNVQNFYYDMVNNKNLKPNSAKRVILVLSKALTYAVKMKLINTVPCNIEYFKEVKERKLQYWTEEQLLYFLNESKSTYLYFPILLAAFTGMRIGELCGLRSENTQLKKRLICVKEQTINDKINKTLIHTDILKTSKSFRRISIPEFLIDEIKEHSIAKKDADFIILDRSNNMCNPRNLSMDFSKKIKKYSKSVDEILESGDIVPSNYMQLPQITFHDLRHTHATILLKHGENIKVISERLGHESIKITLDTYSHVLPSMEEHTALLLDNIFGNNFKT